MKQFNRDLDKTPDMNTNMMEFLFDQSPLSLWIEDYSDVLKLVNELPPSALRDLRSYFAESGDQIDRFIRALKVISVNQATLELFQADTTEQLLGQLGSTFTDHARDLFVNEIQTLVDGKSHYVSETEIMTLRGERRFVSQRFQINSGPDQQAVLDRVLVTMTDITPVKKSIDELQQERDRANRYINLSNVLFVSMDVQGLVNHVNDKTCLILDLPQEDIIGKHWISSFCPVDAQTEIQSVLDRLLAGDLNSFQNYENEVIGRNGRRSIIDWHNSILRDAENKIIEILAFGVDVTHSRALQAQASAMQDQLKQTEKMKSLGILARGVAHEVNNPLTAIMNYASIIEDEDSNPELSEYAADIQEEGKRVGQIISNFLNFARLDKRNLETIAVSKILDSVRLLINQTLMKEGISLTVQECEKSPFIRCRVHEIQHVLFNIVTNAWEAIRNKSFAEGEKKIIQVGAKEISVNGQATARITIQDNGIGIPESELNEFFIPFLTGNLTKPAGIGLGLSVASAIVKDHGGHIHIHSREGQGTTLHIDLTSVEQGVFI